MKKILLIGGLGFVGSVLYEHLFHERQDVEILDNNLYNLSTNSLPFYNVDIRDKKKLEEIIQNFDVIINLAAIVGNPACSVNQKLAMEINCVGTKNIADLCKKYKKFLIHASTCSIYGNKRGILTEREGGFPVDFYGQTKFLQENMIRKFMTNKYCILRFGTVYGNSPRMRYDLIVNRFAAMALRDKKITIFGGNQWRPFVHVKDIARAIQHVIKTNLEGIFNIAYENSTIEQLGTRVSMITGCKMETTNNDIPDIRSYQVDNWKFRFSRFGYLYNLEDGIKEVYKNDSSFFYDYPRYSNVKLINLFKNIKK